MKKIALQLPLAFLILFTSGTIYAQAIDKPKPPEEFYPQFGYKTIGEAIEEFENHTGANVQLPLRIAPLAFTHAFGRFNDIGGEINHSLDIKYLNEDLPENHFKINIRSIKNKTKINDRQILKKVPLNSEKEGMFIEIPGFNVLVVETEQWQYMISVDQRVSNKVSYNELVKIADGVR